ncbi:MAG: Tol-Pal system protein TolR [Chlamydiae bacterium]|nr:Tol-Pal system protein TolR [Chlamydiota bacterium]
MGRRLNNRQSSALSEEAWVNLMPLIDVVFVVLVMFIVIAPMLDVDQVDLAQGTTEIKQQNLSQDLSIHVRADNSIWLNKKQVSVDDLLNTLTYIHNQNPASSLQLYHDRKAMFGTYQTIRSVSQKAGFEHIDVVLKPD